jgi:rubrerythrin
MANPNENLKLAIIKFLKQQNLSDYENKIKGVVLNGDKLDLNKTLSENNVKQNDNMVVVIDNVEKKITLRKISTKDLILAKLILSDFLADLGEFTDLLSLSLQKSISRRNLLPSEMIKKNCDGVRECTHIHTYKHNHGLVLLYSNRDWICNICRWNFKNNEPTYYCSICDFDVCNNCIGINKKYSLEEYYHEQTQLKSYIFPTHEHKMIYCRTSRSSNKDTIWTCNLCFKTYENKIWSFYCTNCDYDICLLCSKKYIPSYEFINNINIKIDDHEHFLVYMLTNRDWICNLCNKSYPNFVPTFYCTKCDYDVCKKCMSKLSDEKKFPLFLAGVRESVTIKFINDTSHQHPLMYCITSRFSNGITKWVCKKCFKTYKNRWSFYCSVCNYDLCYNCYINSKVNNSNQYFNNNKLGYSSII